MLILQKLRIFMCLLVGLTLSNMLFADPVTNVGRLSYIEGSVSLLPTGEDQWIDASLNRPLTVADSLWVDTSSKAELQFGLATVWLNSSSNLKILNLSDTIGQFQITDGTMILNVGKLKSNQSYEIDTPNLALTLYNVGYYRIQVKNEGDTSTTIVTVMTGLAQVYGQNTTTPLEIKEGMTCQFTGTELLNPVCTTMAAGDEFDNWVISRYKQTLKAAESSTKYVSSSIIGYEDLQQYGSWKSDSDYGNVWVPKEESSDWAPYRDGEWIWLSQWGWTWVDNQPWGFAPFHYGRWASRDGIWFWVPGPVNVESTYAPALVAFLDVGEDDVAWFPLGPGDVYVPSYSVSSSYFDQINISNTNFNNIDIHNWYNQNNVPFNYRNRGINNAVTVIPKNAFVQAQPANKSVVNLAKPTLLNAKTNSFAPIAPTNQSVLGGKINTRVKPSQRILNQPAIFKSPIPTQPKSFTQVKDQLVKNPGKPLPETTNNVAAPVQSAPINMHHLQTPIIHHAPAQETPIGSQHMAPAVHHAPMQQTPVGPQHMAPAGHHPPVQEAPVGPQHMAPVTHHAPVQQAPVRPQHMAPAVQHAPVQQAPVRPQHMAPPVQHAPVQQAPARPQHMAPAVQHAPVQQAPVRPQQFQAPPAQHAPMQQAPVRSAPPAQHAPEQRGPNKPQHSQVPHENKMTKQASEQSDSKDEAVQN